MSIFDSMKQSLLEAIKMEHGKDRREEVIRELNLSEKEHRLIAEYNHLIATGQFALAVEFLNENPRLSEDYINLLTDDKHKEVIDKMNEVPNNYPHEDSRFYIPEEYKKHSNEHLKNVKKAWGDYYKDREEMRKALFGEGDKMINMKEVKIKYFTDKIDKLTYIGGSKRSNWIDLRAAETIELKAGDFKLIPLGVAMKLPEGYEAHIAPRSSTFKTWGLIQVNSVGVVDQGYCGDTDQWMMPVYATRDTVINVTDRVCQFRIIENQPEIEFVEVEHMEDESRGGFGSTGKQ